MIYVCEHCRFEFERMSEVEQCPDCGKAAIRGATEGEVQIFRKRLLENLWHSSEKPLAK